MNLISNFSDIYHTHRHTSCCHKKNNVFIVQNMIQLIPVLFRGQLTPRIFFYSNRATSFQVQNKRLIRWIKFKRIENCVGQHFHKWKEPFAKRKPSQDQLNWNFNSDIWRLSYKTYILFHIHVLENIIWHLFCFSSRKVDKLNIDGTCVFTLHPISHLLCLSNKTVVHTCA